MTGLFYAPTLFFAIALLTTSKIDTAGCMRAIQRGALIIAIYGVFITLLHWTGSNLEAMLRAVPVCQPIWTVAVPIVWWVVFSHMAKRTVTRMPDNN